MSSNEQQLSGPDFARGVPASDIVDGKMLLGHFDGEAVLLAKTGAEIFAVGATCTHYNGPLAEGLMVGDTVRCPWHHACFSLRTGEALRAPALNPVSCFRIEESGETVFVREKIEKSPKQQVKPDSHVRSVVIIGGGAAGNATAEMLRRQEFKGTVTILSADDALPHADYRCGVVALAGRPNVGKSTLLNALIGYRLSIVSPRPQTTRHRILGIASSEAGQVLYVDTPGLHRGAKRAMNRSLNRAARAAISDVDLVVQVIEAGRWTDEDEALYAVLTEQKAPRLLVINKVDLSKDKTALLPFVATLGEKHAYDEIHYVSALKKKGLAELQRAILARLPVRAPIYGEDEITDRSERFLAAEMVREQLMLRLDQELPYATTVEIEQFDDRPDGVAEIHAVIWVERDGQKAIVIGQGGAQLKAIGSAARRHMERLFERKVFLKLWVKVREGWVDDEAMLKKFGYTD